MIAAEDQAFLEAVLAVAAQALKSGTSVAHLAKDYGNIPQAELTVCAAQALRLVGSSHPQAAFREFSAICRVVAQVISPQEPTLTQRTLRHLTTAHHPGCTNPMTTVMGCRWSPGAEGRGDAAGRAAAIPCARQGRPLRKAASADRRGAEGEDWIGMVEILAGVGHRRPDHRVGGKSLIVPMA